MGMFDTVEIPRKLLPLNRKQLRKLPKDPNFQTKSLDRSLTRYKIKGNGELLEYTNDGHRQVYRDATNDPLLSPMHVMFRNLKTKAINPHWKKVTDFTGSVNFYTNLNKPFPYSGWVEFEAEFNEGILTGIELTEWREN